MDDTEYKKHSLNDLMGSPNIATMLDDEQVKKIGLDALAGYNEDVDSRSEWTQRNALGMKLALQVSEAKTFPWPDCANVKFPLLTVAALQFHARAFPSLIAGTDVAQARVIGLDPDGAKTARAERISTHMSWQCLEQDKAWRGEHDKGLLVAAINGAAFIKQAFDNAKGHVVTRLVFAKDFVVNYYTHDLETSPRYTHTFDLSSNDIYQRQKDKRFCVYDEPGDPQPTPSTAKDQNDITEAVDKRQGVTKPADDKKTTPYFTGEQYCWLDLDGDGYREPYVVTIDVETGRVWRIVARFDERTMKALGGARWREGDEIYSIEPIPVFYKLPFIPSPDGGFYELGLGALAGPINDSVNSAFNQLFDAGTMSSLGGGFVGRGFKSKGGPFTFKPNEWHQSDAPGDDLRKNILPLPVKSPDQVFFQLIEFLINYAERIVSATEIQVGDSPGQNQKAATTQILNENGSRVYTAIYQRMWGAMREGFNIRYGLNELYLPVDVDFTDLTTGKGAIVMVADYRGSRLSVVPSADPNVVSDAQREKQAMFLVNAAYTWQGVNKFQAQTRALKAMKIPAIDEVMPHPQQKDEKTGQMVDIPDFPAMPNPKMIDAQVKQGKLELDKQRFQSEVMQQKVEWQQEVLKINAQIAEIYAKAELELASADASGKNAIAALIDAQVGMLRERNAGLMKLIDVASRHQEKSDDRAARAKPNGAGVDGVAAAPQDAGDGSGSGGINLADSGNMVH